MRKYTAYQVTRTNTHVGTKYADSRIYSTLFRNQGCPLDLGVIDVEVFSKQVNGKLVDMPMTFRAGKNIVELSANNDGKVTWKLSIAGVPRARIVDVDPNLGTYPGQAGTRFKVALNVPFYHEPVLLRTESRDAPRLRVLGYPVTEAPDKHWYEVELQTGNPSDYVPSEYLQIGRTLCDDSTSVAQEMNQKYAGIEFGSTANHASQISYFAREFTVTDKVIRKELDTIKKGDRFEGTYTKDGTFLNSIIGTGYVIYKSGAKKEEYIRRGQLLTNIEMMLRRRIYRDREYDMIFGKTQTSFDEDSGYLRTNGPGWLEIAKEGNYQTHDGLNITLQDIVNQIYQLKFNVDDPKDDVIEIDTGTSGMILANHLISLEVASLPFTLSSNYFIDEVPSQFTSEGLRAGHQFVEFHNFGRIFRFVWNPMKDNLDVFPEIDSDTGRPLESESFDIFSLSENKDALGNKQNIAMAHEPGAYFWVTVSNIYNFATGAIQDGSNVYSASKNASVKMEINGGLVVFDVSGTARFARI